MHKENKAVMERRKMLCTQDDIVNLREKWQKMDIADHFTRDRAHTKLNFHKLTNFTEKDSQGL